MKIRNFYSIIIIAFLLNSTFSTIINAAGEGNLNKELKDLIAEDNFPELYDIEPMSDKELKSKDVTYSVRRHQNNKILEKLKRKNNVKEFISNLDNKFTK